MAIEDIIKVLGLLGLGGFFGTYFRILWERQNTALIQKQEFKETRYKCIILLMHGALDFDKNKPMLNQHGRNFQSLDDLMNEIKTEWHNMILYASDEVLTQSHAFICQPTQATFRKVALAMRSDLWGGKVSAQLEQLTFD